MPKSNGLNCVICGVGGQGNVLASRLLADALLARDEHVKTAETIGMAQRGGSVASHVRGGHPQSPLVPKGCADCVIAFEPGEAVRCIDFLLPEGMLIASTHAVQPPTAALQDIDYDGSGALAYLRELLGPRLIEVPGHEIAEKAGSPKVLNIALLAAATKTGALGITREELEAALKARIKPQFHAMNLKAIELIFDE